MAASLHIIYASTSGHTEYVVLHLLDWLKVNAPAVSAKATRAEKATRDSLLDGDVVVLACGSWNTGGPEGQLSPFMQRLLREQAADVDLKGAKVAVIGLGDERYRYVAHSADLLCEYVRTHGGILLEPVLRVVNEPYGQENLIADWAASLVSSITA